jgi:malonyl-CoA O-methyltransferase
MRRQIKHAFNRAAATYDEHCQVQITAGKQLLEFIKIYFQPNAKARLLDLGCGTGLITEQLLRCIPHAKIQALDIAEQLLAQARIRLKKFNADVYSGDFDHLPEQAAFDLIFSNMALHWSKQFAQTLAALNALICKQGLLAFSIPLSGTFTELNSFYACNTFYSKEQVEAQLTAAQQKIIFSSAETYCLQFAEPLEALRSIKKIGANFITKEPLQKGLRGKDFLKQHQNKTLTYVIGYFLSQPRE